MTKEIQIIPVNSEAYKASVELRQRVLRSPLGLTLTASDTANDANEYHLGAFECQTLIGCLVLRPLDRHRVRLRQMAVETNYRGKGIGSKLLRYAEQLAFKKGFTQIQIHARSQMKGFYERFGYQLVGEEFIEVMIPHVLMTKNLGVEFID